MVSPARACFKSSSDRVDQPITDRELFVYITNALGVKDPNVGGPLHVPSFRTSNRLIKEKLGWTPHDASYGSGLAGVLPENMPRPPSR